MAGNELIRGKFVFANYQFRELSSIYLLSVVYLTQVATYGKEYTR